MISDIRVKGICWARMTLPGGPLSADRVADGRAPGLPAGAARPELDPGQDGDGHQQPRGEQEVHGEAEDGQPTGSRPSTPGWPGSTQPSRQVTLSRTPGPGCVPGSRGHPTAFTSRSRAARFATSPAMSMSSPCWGGHRTAESQAPASPAGTVQEAGWASVVMPSSASRAAIQRTRSLVVMPGGMSMTFWPALAQVERTTRSAADCRSRTLAR
jgi:hypothetical protein